MASTTSAVSIPSFESRGCLRNPTFDFHFIVTISVLAIATGCSAIVRPDLFTLFLMLDVWLLGYHHVVSTFTRLVFDRQSFQDNKFLVVYLPVIVVTCTAASMYFVGSWTIATTYLYWQWFHYTRQSYGIERMYRRKADENASIDDYATTRLLYLVPIFGILYRSWQQPNAFLGTEVFTFAVPTLLLVIVGIVAAAATVYWCALQVHAYSQGKLATAHCAFVVSHLAIFLFGYVLIEDITAGWLVINIWHNAQYILFVWWFNNKRFEKGVEPKSRFLSTISQRENMLIYMGICLAISTVFYFGLTTATSAFKSSTTSLTVLALMTLNFHHYIVDGIIWKRKRLKPKADSVAASPSPA
jgi:hypothetical protein